VNRISVVERSRRDAPVRTGRDKPHTAYRFLLSILMLPDALGTALARRYVVTWGGSYGDGYDWSQWVADIVCRDGRRREFDGETWFELRLDRLLDAYMYEAGPATVVSTPGAEPVAEGGYGTVLLLDSWGLLGRPDLRAGEETLRRWLAAAALTRPAGDGGTVFVGAAGGLAAVQVLLRWAPAWHAARELADRTELGFPPATRLASITGPPVGVANLIAAADLPAGAKLLGPVPLPEDRERVLVRVSRPAGAELARALAAAQAVRSARKAPEPVRVELDPLELF